jgi:CBS domain-containing protein/anti-sigma regulatory factor (Ser/Thr protein kinase)
MLQFPGNETPTTIQEVILRLKVKDASKKQVITARKTDSLRHIQNMMRVKGISAVPILDDDLLVGMISLRDIITALDKSYINDLAEKHMAKSLIILEDDMPLSYAIPFFNKYSYHRFPVVDKDKRLSGILSSRDILLALLRELNKEIIELEKMINAEPADQLNRIKREFIVKKFDFENAGRASFELKKLLKSINAPRQTIRKASVAAYELEINIAIHSEGGILTFEIDEKDIVITARDKGPGIEDINLALQPGYSTASDWIRSMGFGAGMGLANTKKVSDNFIIESNPKSGSLIQSTIHLHPAEELDAILKFS